MDSKTISPIAAGILEGLNEALQDAAGKQVDGLQKTVVYAKNDYLAEIDRRIDDVMHGRNTVTFTDEEWESRCV